MILEKTLVIANGCGLSRGLNALGISPRNLIGLRGILFAPFLHGGFYHLISNTVPFVVLGWLVMIRNTKDFMCYGGESMIHRATDRDTVHSMLQEIRDRQNNPL